MTPQQYPGAFTNTEARLLRCIGRAGWWSVDPKCMTRDEQICLEYLRFLGYIEHAAYGGWRVKGNMWTVGRVSS